MDSPVLCCFFWSQQGREKKDTSIYTSQSESQMVLNQSNLTKSEKAHIDFDFNTFSSVMSNTWYSSISPQWKNNWTSFIFWDREEIQASI